MDLLTDASLLLRGGSGDHSHLPPDTISSLIILLKHTKYFSQLSLRLLTFINYLDVLILQKLFMFERKIRVFCDIDPAYKTFSSKLVLKVLDGKKASQEIEDKEKENYLKV